MRAVRRVLTALLGGGDRQWMVPLAVLSGLLTHFFGWMGYCVAFMVAIFLQHRIWAFAQRRIPTASRSSEAPTV